MLARPSGFRYWEDFKCNAIPHSAYTITTQHPIITNSPSSQCWAKCILLLLKIIACVCVFLIYFCQLYNNLNINSLVMLFPWTGLINPSVMQSFHFVEATPVINWAFRIKYFHLLGGKGKTPASKKLDKLNTFLDPTHGIKCEVALIRFQKKEIVAGGGRWEVLVVISVTENRIKTTAHPIPNVKEWHHKVIFYPRKTALCTQLKEYKSKHNFLKVYWRTNCLDLGLLKANTILVVYL